MAEGLEAAYHVPQQSRREKLRDPRLLYDITPPIPSDFQIDPSTLHILNNTPFFNNQLQPQPLSLSLPPNDDVVSSSSSSTLLLPPPPSYAAASFLKASRFLVPAQQLLDDLCHVGQPRVTHAPDHFDTTSFIEPPSSSSPETFASGDASQGCWKKSRLLTMLDEVYKRYMQYCQQIQAVVSSFEYVSGLSNAAPYATLAIRAMFKHFKSLKNVITDQLHQFTNSNNKGYNFHNISNKINDAGGGQIIRATNQNQNPEFVGHQQPIWRPQRGLPERAVTVLRAWLFDHFLHPYPTDSDKIMLAKQTGLSRSQVSNWFINARVRVWKPMVEEIHMLETRQQQSHPQKNNNPDHHHQNQTHHHQIINNNNITKEQNNKYYSTCDTKFEDSPFKRTRNIYNPPPNNNNNNNNDNNNNLGAVTNNGVSLTLGLHQNNVGLALPEPSFPIEAHRFGLHSDHQGFVVSASQDSHIESSLWKRNLL